MTFYQLFFPEKAGTLHTKHQTGDPCRDISVVTSQENVRQNGAQREAPKPLSCQEELTAWQ